MGKTEQKKHRTETNTNAKNIVTDYFLTTSSTVFLICTGVLGKKWWVEPTFIIKLTMARNFLTVNFKYLFFSILVPSVSLSVISIYKWVKRAVRSCIALQTLMITSVNTVVLTTRPICLWEDILISSFIDSVVVNELFIEPRINLQITHP